MKTKFIFIRHAQSTAKEDGIVQGEGLDVHLSRLGEKQVEKIGEVLKGMVLDFIFSSQAVRAIKTAEAIRKYYPGVPYAEIFELNERSKGEAEGMQKDDFKKAYSHIEAAWEREEDPRPPGGESFSDVELRIMPLIFRHLEKYCGKTILYVGHGNAFRVALGAMLGVPVAMRNRIAQDYCAISIAEYDHQKKRWNVLLVNKNVISN